MVFTIDDEGAGGGFVDEEISLKSKSNNWLIIWILLLDGFDLISL